MIRTTLARANARQKPIELTELNTNKIFWLIVLHIGLALFIDNFRFAATIHALLVFALGVRTALTSEDIRKVIPYAAYIVGAEVLWRMSKASVFWEFGKYATVAILVIALLKNKKKLQAPWLPILYFLMFIPSMFLTINSLGWTERARELISFNLSGPLSAAICMLFFLQVEINEELINKTIWAMVYPLVGILSLAIYSTVTATAIDFGTEAVFVTSGGYGPNQVSAMLGLGAFGLILWMIQTNKKGGRLLAIALSLGFIVQSFLTFSRGGIYNLVIALAAALLVLLSKPSKFVRSFSIVFFILVIIGIFAFPQMEELTSGALSVRFQNLDPTNRISLAEADLNLFFENPIAGVGPGMGTASRLFGGMSAAHTEYTRTLAEHGAFGVFALLFLLLQLGIAFFKAPNTVARAWMVAFAVWSGVEMGHSAMRIVAISFLLGLAVVSWKHEEPEEVSRKKPATRLARFRP